MRLVVVTMPGICVPSIATVSLLTQHEAEAPAPDKAPAELTDGEKLFQGHWQFHFYESARHTGTLHIDGRDFHADTVHG